MSVDFITAIKIYFANYANFKGRSTRAEYWWAMLFVFIVGLVAQLFGEKASYIAYLALLMPNLAVLTRRYHDIGHSGWWILAQYVLAIAACGFGLSAIVFAVKDGAADLEAVLMANVGKIGLATLVSLAVAIWTIIWCCKPSGPDNKYGPNPWNE